MQNQQIGGRQKVPVTLGLHHLRAYMRHQKSRLRSCGILFLDLKEAFYRVVRPLVVDIAWTDEDVARIAFKLDLPPSALEELRHHLSAPSATAQAQLPKPFRNFIAALHSDTWFSMDQQPDCCRTTIGSRPGDCFADTVFAFLWARVLRSLEHILSAHDCLDRFPVVDHHDPFADHAPLPGSTDPHESCRPYLGPTWMDDLAVCVC